jgi:hypothetical protein
MPIHTPTYRASTINDIKDEIVGGLQCERTRLDDAMFNLEFYEGDFSRFPPRSPGQAYDSRRYFRNVPIMQRIVNVLTDHLYASGPVRVIADQPEATEWLENIYRRNTIDALWQAAEQMSGVTSLAAFQVEASEDPFCPLAICLWDGSQLCVWTHPDQPLEPLAVATIDLYDYQRRVRLWTETEMTTYVTEKWNPGIGNAATAYRQEGPPVPNPYGVIPFSFVHWRKPVRDFWTTSPGTRLRAMNDGLNFFLTEHFDCVRYNTRPVIVLKNVRAGWRPPKPIKPGDVWDLPADEDSEGDAKQTADYLQADPGFIMAGWEDANHFIDLALECDGVPPATFRLVQDAAASGIQVVVEQIPLIAWATKRQRQFQCYETELAKLVFRIGAVHLGTQDFRAYQLTGQMLQKAADDPLLTLRWPSMWPDIPGDDRDRGDQWLLDNGMSSRTMLLMRRDRLTRQEAEAKLEEIAEDLERERELFAEHPPQTETTEEDEDEDAGMDDMDMMDEDMDDMDTMGDDEGENDDEQKPKPPRGRDGARRNGKPAGQ